MNEVKLRLAIRDLYRGDGGPLSSYDEGWNDGTDAAAEILYPLVERAEGGEMTESEKMSYQLEDTTPFVDSDGETFRQAAALLREQEQKIKRMAEALKRVRGKCFFFAVEGIRPDEWNLKEWESWCADALRDAGVGP